MTIETTRSLHTSSRARARSAALGLGTAVALAALPGAAAVQRLAAEFQVTNSNASALSCTPDAVFSPGTPQAQAALFTGSPEVTLEQVASAGHALALENVAPEIRGITSDGLIHLPEPTGATWPACLGLLAILGRRRDRRLVVRRPDMRGKVLIAALAVIAATGEARGSEAYRAVALADPHGDSYAYAINDWDVVTGTQCVPSGDGCILHAMVFDRGSTVDIGAAIPNQGQSQGRGINDSGSVIGEGNAMPGGFLYRAESFTSLVQPPFLGYTRPMGINSSELIVGDGQVLVDGRGHTHAFAYQDGAITDLGSLPGAGEESGATSVNDSGEIAGWMWLSSPLGARIHAFAYREGMIIDLGTLPGDRNSWAAAINSSGQIVGWSESERIAVYYFYSVGRRRAFLVEHGVMRDLGTLPGTDYSQAHGINDSGWVVGYAYDEILQRVHAFVWTPSTLMTELPPLAGCESAFAFAINSAGTIAGNSSGCVDGPMGRATLWEPLPEPGVGVASIAGAALLAGLGRRRRQSIGRSSWF